MNATKAQGLQRRTAAVFFAAYIALASNAVAQVDIPDDEWKKLRGEYPALAQIVVSPAFKEWLRNQSPEVQELSESRNAAGAIRVLNMFQKYRLETSQPGTFRLICTMQLAAPAKSTAQTEQNFWVDELTKKVSGYPANITTEIIEHTVDTSDSIRVTINRLSGTIQLSDSKFPVLATGRCSKATDRKF